MHKIFKLCGSPSEDFWETTKFPQATSYRPQHPYKRVLLETFKNLPSSSLALLDRLLSVEPEKRCSASSTLLSEVMCPLLFLLTFFIRLLKIATDQ